MVDDDAKRAAREAVRARERAVWTEVERIGREARAADAAKQQQTMTQAERDAAAKKPTEGMSA
jgi:hypothetical protein